MPTLRDPGIAVIGTGWMAWAHTEALRRLGFAPRGIAGRTADSAKDAAADLGLGTAYPSVEALLSDDAVRAVHITSPNDVHAEQVEAALRAGKHVICEKPLGVSSDETARLLGLARQTGLVNVTCFNLRFYPHNHQAAGLVRAGAIGEPRLVSGGYHQDWLLLETDWNWRLDTKRQGGLRAVADIGSHWLDLVRFISGQRVTEVLADLHTFVPQRFHPRREVKTFAAASVSADEERVREVMASDDAAGVLLRFEGGARGVASISQVAAGRKNRVTWQLDGSDSAMAWVSEDPEQLWIGHRGRPNEVMSTDPSMLTSMGASATRYPAGHVEGYPDTFVGLFAAAYADIATGAPAAEPSYPTFADGHDAAVVCDAIAESARTRGWATVDRESP